MDRRNYLSIHNSVTIAQYFIASFFYYLQIIPSLKKFKFLLTVFIYHFVDYLLLTRK